MHLKTLLFGMLLGAALALAGVYYFGDDMRDGVRKGARELGEGVQKAGEVLEEQSEKLR